MKKHSHSVSSVALAGMKRGGPGWVAWSDGGGMVRSGPAFTARHRLPDTGSRPTEPVATSWWAVFGSLMEGFALYGAAMHPIAAAPVHAMLEAARDCQLSSAGRERPDPALKSGRDEADDNGNVVRLERVGSRDAQPERGWDRLHALGETLMALPAHWRREREINRAVAALMELDDRTLRDLGIAGRSEIERVVRYCRDC
ncbi:DUF1127 domain-containing protein [Bradyrhizobium sp. P5_C12]